MANTPPSRHSPPDSPVPAHAPLPHPLTQPRGVQRPADARSSQQSTPNSHSSSNGHDTGAPAPAFAPGRHPLPRNFPAPPINSHLSKSVSDSAALDAATAAITRAGGNLDVGDTGLLDDLCERLSNPELYTRPITRQRIIELLEIASEEIAKTRAAGLWEITARVAQERHFVCPPQMEGTVKSYIKMVDTVNENSSSFDEAELIARLDKINQSKPFQANIPANTACLFCRKRKIKCDGSLPQCDMCAKHRQAKCEYPQKSHYGGFSNRGGVHYVVPMGPDIAAAAASSAAGASPPIHLDLGKAVKGYAPVVPTVAPTFILPGPAPPSTTPNPPMYADPQRPTDAPAPRGRQAPEPAPRRDSHASSTGAPPHYDPVRNGAINNYSPHGSGVKLSPPRSHHSAYGQGTRRGDARDTSSTKGMPRSESRAEKGWDDGYADEDEDDARPVSSTSSQILQNRHAAHLARNGNQDVEMEDIDGANEAPRRRSPHTGHERCINCDTDKTSLWRKDEDGRTICNACQIYFRVHGRKRPPSMRSSTVKKRPGRQPRPSTGPHPLPGHELYIHRIDDDSFSSDRAHPIDSSQHHVLRPKGVPMSYAQPAPPSAHKHMGHSPRSSGSRSPNPHERRRSPPPPTGEFVQQQQQHLRVIEQAIANGQRTQPASTAGLDYALSGSRTRASRQPQAEEGYRGRTDYVSTQDRQISPEARNSYNRDNHGQSRPSPSVDTPMADGISEDRHRREPGSRRTSDEHRNGAGRDPSASPEDETEVQAGENLCAVEGGRSPADVLVFRFDADRAKAVCATQWAHLRSPSHSVEDDLRFHLNCYRKNPPESTSQERVTLGVATDWLPKAGVYSITSGDEPPNSHHMAPPPHGKLNQTIDITSEIREGLNTLKFTQLRDMSDCVLVVQIWKVGRKPSGPPPRGGPSPSGHPQYSGMAPPGSVPDKPHSRASLAARAPPVYEAVTSPGLHSRATPPPASGRSSKLRNGDKANGTAAPTGARRSCLYCFNNRIACRPSHQENLGCEECLRRGIQCAMPEEYSTDLGFHASVDRKPMINPAIGSPPSHIPTHVQGYSHGQAPPASTPLSPGSISGTKRKQEEQLPAPPAPANAPAPKAKRAYKRKQAAHDSASPPTQPPQPQVLPPMHHIQHIPPPPAQSGFAAALSSSTNGNRPTGGSAADSRANQDLRRHQDMMIKQQQDAERENARVLAGGLPTPYA